VATMVDRGEGQNLEDLLHDPSRQLAVFLHLKFE